MTGRRLFSKIFTQTGASETRVFPKSTNYQMKENKREGGGGTQSSETGDGLRDESTSSNFKKHLVKTGGVNSPKVLLGIMGLCLFCCGGDAFSQQQKGGYVSVNMKDGANAEGSVREASTTIIAVYRGPGYFDDKLLEELTPVIKQEPGAANTANQTEGGANMDPDNIPLPPPPPPLPLPASVPAVEKAPAVVPPVGEGAGTAALPTLPQGTVDIQKSSAPEDTVGVEVQKPDTANGGGLDSGGGSLPAPAKDAKVETPSLPALPVLPASQGTGKPDVNAPAIKDAGGNKVNPTGDIIPAGGEGLPPLPMLGDGGGKAKDGKEPQMPPLPPPPPPLGN